MIDPYDFVGSPTTTRAKQTRKKTIRQTTKRKQLTERTRLVSIQETPSSKSPVRTRSSARNVDQSKDKNNMIDIDAGFTPLIQTKMLDVKTRQDKQTRKQTNKITDDNQSTAVARKRQRSGTCRFFVRS
jgi:hypothetical protein